MSRLSAFFWAAVFAGCFLVCFCEFCDLAIRVIVFVVWIGAVKRVDRLLALVRSGLRLRGLLRGDKRVLFLIHAVSLGLLL